MEEVTQSGNHFSHSITGLSRCEKEAEDSKGDFTWHRDGKQR